MMLHISLTMYRWLLHLYPVDFRDEYGDLMLYVFEEACRDAKVQGSAWAWLRIWRRTGQDIMQSLYHEHRTKKMTHKINGYEINATIGEGAAAAVYRAYDPKRAEQVALKLFNPDSEEEILLRFDQEGQVHQQLEHRNIPRCYGYEHSEDGKYIIMQYINGKTLLELLQERNKPFSPQQVIKWAYVACDVLIYLHEKGYVYRDMKPGNMMLTPEGDLYIIDYGITVLGEGDGVAIGTIGYAPPEQYKANVTAQSDIYALGASLHHLLTNRDPRYHEAHTFHQAPPRMYNPDITSALETVIMKALADEPSARYQTADGFKQALLNAGKQLNGGVSQTGLAQLF